jgi:hypothetical protein
MRRITMMMMMIPRRGWNMSVVAILSAPAIDVGSIDDHYKSNSKCYLQRVFSALFTKGCKSWNRGLYGNPIRVVPLGGGGFFRGCADE